MDFNPASALHAQFGSKAFASPDQGQGGAAARAGAMFADFASTLQAADAAAQATITSGADPQVMVEAVAQAQLALETAVTVRDRAVEAYQEILRMPI